VFEGNSDAENATLIANGGTNGGDGGTIQFWDTSDGGTARIELFGNGALDLSNVADTYLDLGSIEGNGMISLGDRHNISIGTNNLSTTFSGVIEGDSSLGKVGSGTLTLSGANTHTQGTYVSSGFLKVTNRTGSATGTGQVNVYDGGTLGGSGIVGSNLLVHAGGTLAPGTGTTTLTVKKLLDFDGNSNYDLESQDRLGQGGQGDWGQGSDYRWRAFYRDCYRQRTAVTRGSLYRDRKHFTWSN
jgi:autotransporter-associated beta strand protein